MIRRLARKLSALKQFVGFVMAEAVIERSGGGAALKILSAKKNLAIVETSGAGLRLTVKLFYPARPPHKGKALKTLRGDSSNVDAVSAPRGDYWRKFSREEVASFIRETDDDNTIHQGAHPIVPGFLIVEALLNDRRLIERKKIRLRFKHFTATDEALYLTFDGEQFYVDADERKIEGWILDN